MENENENDIDRIMKDVNNQSKLESDVCLSAINWCQNGILITISAAIFAQKVGISQEQYMEISKNVLESTGKLQRVFKAALQGEKCEL
jgi:hypothetical protein